MSLEKILAFLQVCEVGSINRAAANLYISQQSLSRAISTLEEEVGQPLFIRSARGVSLTAFGKLFQGKAIAVRDAMDALKAACTEYQMNEPAAFSIAAPQSYNYSSTSAALDASLKLYEAAYSCNVKRVATRDDNNDSPIEAILSGEADIAYISGPTEKEYVVAYPIYRFPLKVLFSTESELVAKETVTAHDLRDVSFVIPPRSTGFSRTIIEYCRENGFKPKIAQEIRISKALVNMVSKNVGITFINEESATEAMHLYDNLLSADLEPRCELVYSLAIVKKRANDPKLLQAIRFLTQSFSSEYRFYGI